MLVFFDQADLDPENDFGFHGVWPRQQNLMSPVRFGGHANDGLLSHVRFGGHANEGSIWN